MALETTDTVGGVLPVPIGGGHVTSGSATTNTHADVFIDGLALNLHITPPTPSQGTKPYQRETAEQTKPQFDITPLAGEHTLTNYWIRSQMSLHAGAGIKYLDTSQADVQAATSTSEYRFDTSRGIDVWTKGEVKRLPDTSLLATTSGKTWLYSTTLSNGETYLIYAAGSTIQAKRQVAGDTITYTVTGMAGTIKDLVIDGSNYWVATTDGHVFSGPIDNSAAGTAKWDFTSTSDVKLGWVKARLMAGINNAVYELAGTGPTLPAALYTHPNPAWRWSCWSELPAAVIAAGTAGTYSAIFAFSISNNSSGVPVLQPGVVASTMPTGEVVNAILYYTDNRVVFGTSVGLRVGDFQSFYGTLSYGPLSYPSRLEDSTPVTSLKGRGSFIYAGTVLDGEATLIRVDLGTLTDQGVHAWAPDIRTPSGAAGQVDAITVDSSLRLRFAVRGYGVVGEDPAAAQRDAWLRTGRIRFGTIEGKHFKYGTIRSEGTGNIDVYLTSDTQPTEKKVYSFDASDASQRFSLLSGPAEWIQLRFDMSGSAVITSYQIQALPSGYRSRLITLPVQIFDKEKNRHGITVSAPGRAKKILDTLEAYEANGDELTLQVPCLGIDATRVTVEKFTFTQTSNPSANKKVDVGGYGTLVFRTTT